MCNQYVIPLSGLKKMLKYYFRVVMKSQTLSLTMVFATNAACELDGLGEGVASLPPFASHGSIAAHWRAICQVHWDGVFRVGVQEAKTSSARRCRPTTCSRARSYKSTKSVLSLSYSRSPASYFAQSARKSIWRGGESEWETLSRTPGPIN